MKNNKIYILLIALVILVSILALLGGVIEPDSALYASIAKNIILNNDWVNLYVRGQDWLDKPHLTFWIAAVSFKLFGVNAFAYKLPSFLFGLLGGLYTYKLGKKLCNQETGLLSALIFLSSLHLLVSTFDVRAEIYIATFVLGSIYHFYRAHQSAFWHLLLGSIFAACAVMIKGVFVLVPILMGFIIYWIFTKQYYQFLKLKWYLAIILILLFITPELYALYVQFDLHPEKIVFGKTGTSGLKFFFWDSQFGRFFNTGPIRGKGDPTFFIHTTLWAFLPWSVLFYAAIVNLFKKKNRIDLPKEIIIIWASAFVTFMLFSLSKFQLPHYILIILPQFAIITAIYIKKLNIKGINIFFIVQNVILVLVVVLLILLALFFDVQGKFIAITILVLVFVLSIYFFRSRKITTIIARSSFISIALMIFLSGFFYPSLLKYEAGMQAGNWLSENFPKAKPAVLLHQNSFSFDFYANGVPLYFLSYEDLKNYSLKTDLVIYTPESELQNLKANYGAVILKTFEYYHITKLKANFINSKTRPQSLQRFYLVKIN